MSAIEDIRRSTKQHISPRQVMLIDDDLACCATAHTCGMRDIYLPTHFPNVLKASPKWSKLHPNVWCETQLHLLMLKASVLAKSENRKRAADHQRALDRANMSSDEEDYQ